MKRVLLAGSAALIAGLASMPSAQAADVVRSGTIIVNVAITLTTAVPAGSSVECDVNVGVSDTVATYAELSSAVATVSGSTATCTMRVPYEWTLAAPATDTIGRSVGTAIVPTGAAATARTRSEIQNLPPVAGVPATGTQTIWNVASRL